jgi:ribosomal-protein-alanine N-acetyltransferase
MKTLATPRLILREYTEDDAPAFFALNSDPEVMRYVPDELMVSIEQAREILRSHPITDYKERGFGRFACILKATGEHIGFSGLKYLKEIEAVDLGFRFVPSQWRKGLATEAAVASIRYGFDELKLDRILGLAGLENRGSIRVLEKAGMRFVQMVRLFSLSMAKYVIERDHAKVA